MLELLQKERYLKICLVVDWFLQKRFYQKNGRVTVIEKRLPRNTKFVMVKGPYCHICGVIWHVLSLQDDTTNFPICILFSNFSIMGLIFYCETQLFFILNYHLLIEDKLKQKSKSSSLRG